MLKENRIRDKKHRRWISSLPCCVSGIQGMTQAAHIRSGCFSMGMKPCDSLIVPLSVSEHAKQHATNENSFWEPYGGIGAAKSLAKYLYSISGDTNAAILELMGFRQ